MKTLLFSIVAIFSIVVIVKASTKGEATFSKKTYYKTSIDSTNTNPNAIFCADLIRSSTNKQSLSTLVSRIKTYNKNDYVILYRNDIKDTWKLEDNTEKFDGLLSTVVLNRISIGEGNIVIQNKKYSTKKYVVVINI
jgi:hypothetical protein